MFQEHGGNGGSFEIEITLELRLLEAGYILKLGKAKEGSILKIRS